jgi:hypothetical protein
MTVTAHLESEGHSATISNDGKPVLSYTENWLLQDTTSSSVNIHQARLNFTSATGITPGAQYGNYTYSLCRTVTPTKRPTRQPYQAWDVAVEYTTDCPLIDDPNPANRRWIREVTDSEQQRFIFRDRNNKLIVDAAGSPFDGGIPVNVRLKTWTWEHNVDASNYQLGKDDISGTINSDYFMGREPGTMYLTYRAKENWEGQYHFFTEFYTIIYDPLGWKPKPANAGLFYLNQKNGKTTRTRIQVNGKDVVEPEPLSKDGYTVIPYDRRPQDCNFITVEYYESIPFNALNLPTT